MLNKFYASLPRRQEGATAVEYGLIAGLIAVAIVVVLGLVGGSLSTVFTSIQTALANI
ncbi:MAG: Pilus assembly protein Flp/PilA [Hydrocarboniphaga sp.]|uniref:Flp family type IVb pilin n=1 Tax=Hydrocarboniphaga sp. TaxID=2033016 RepID=UPI00261A2905|nr:Flp family type IVb pilin [Hydrocarboniphaga sp.]MDB5972397.1 Pilus assembly protein Flp/PilA [Hydrocarboniphaga sp.]